MSKDYQNGRADAAKGTYDPPKEPLGGLLSSTREVNRTAERAGNYREGYYDKKGESKK